MLYLFLDESGDLGFNFVNKKPSKYFVVTILAINGPKDRKQVSKAVERTLKNKLNQNRAKRKAVQELKGTNTNIEIKKYFFKKIESYEFKIYSVVLNKRKTIKNLFKNKHEIYNYLTSKLVNKLPLSKHKNFVKFYLDKSKAMKEIIEFNDFIIESLKNKLSPETSLEMHHSDSVTVKELQAVDLFSWGIFRKYERSDIEWYDLYKSKIASEDIHLM